MNDNFKLKAWDLYYQPNAKFREVHSVIFKDGEIHEINLNMYNVKDGKVIIKTRKPEDVKLIWYTGRHDKDNTDIYIGDILEVLDGDCMDYIVESIGKLHHDRINTEHDCRIKGNRFENPELLPDWEPKKIASSRIKLNNQLIKHLKQQQKMGIPLTDEEVKILEQE